MPEGTEQTEKQEENTMNTTYFDEMTANCIAWENAKKERDARREQIFQTYGWKSPEMEAWKAEDQAAVRPYSNGAMKAYFVFKQHCASEAAEVEIDSYCWDSEYHDFVETLRKLGITEFTLTNHSTALMDNIHGLIAEGCTLIGAHTITKKCPLWLGEDHETVKGLLFKVN